MAITSNVTKCAMNSQKIWDIYDPNCILTSSEQFEGVLLSTLQSTRQPSNLDPIYHKNISALANNGNI